MLRLAADLHIHTVLSPCASRDMRPPAIVREAVDKGLAMIAVCDHNSAGNVAAVAQAARSLEYGLAVIAGIEITTVEEVHVLGYFPDAAAADRASSEVLASLPPWKALSERTSRGRGVAGGPRTPEQERVGADGAMTCIETRMLAAASGFTLSRTVELIHRYGGLAVAAHMDRRSFSVPGQLGFLPPDIPFDALEISAQGLARGRAEEFRCHGLPLVSSSDGHFLSDIGSSWTALEVESPCFEELVRAIRGIEGRGCSVA